MSLSFHDSTDPNGLHEHFEYNFKAGISHSKTAGMEKLPLLRDKLTVPALGDVVPRPRIDALLERSAVQFPATLISGRAGTGKTAIAAMFAARRDNVAWFSVESTDVLWNSFARYFSAALSRTAKADTNSQQLLGVGNQVERGEIARFLLQTFAAHCVGIGSTAPLIVLDDIQHIFDTEWFEDFFNFLLYSLPSQSHLLLLCRSKPPGPLWRLRSKQMLNVLDEKVIAFNLDETQRLFSARNLNPARAEDATRSSFGRISKLLLFEADTAC